MTSLVEELERAEWELKLAVDRVVDATVKLRLAQIRSISREATLDEVFHVADKIDSIDTTPGLEVNSYTNKHGV